MRGRRFFIIGVLFASPIFVLAQQELFVSRDLRIGDRGADVRTLQRILNKDFETRIAESGPGSSGFETDYFGSMTRAAVIKFQNKYRVEVLYQAGLFTPTGFVGPLTRAKLNKLGGAKTATNPSTTTSYYPVSNQNVPTVNRVSPASVREGQTFTIYGTNFTPTGNTVVLRFGVLDLTFQNVPSSDGVSMTLTFTPPSTNPISASELKTFPSDLVATAHTAFSAQNLSLDTLTDTYTGLHNEEELDALLKKYGRSIKDLEDQYVILVKNKNGSSQNVDIFLKGMRRLKFN